MGTTETRYHYFNGQLMYETQNDVITAQYVRSSTGKLLAVKLNNAYYYYHYNAAGDITAVTDANGDVFRQYLYDPYGNVISLLDGDGQPVLANGQPITNNIQDDPGFNHAYTYKGYRYDSESGLYFLNSRYYAAGIGSFLTKDSYLSSDLNRYTYSGGDPVNISDPSGSFWETVLDVFSLAWDTVNFIEEPSWENAAYLAWDVAAAFVPFVPGSYVGKALKATSDVAETVQDLKIIEKTQKGGRLGNAETRDQIKQIADKLESKGWTITGGGGKTKEEYLPGPNGGRKGSNWVDITAQKNGKVLRINTVDTYANGQMTQREAKAAKQIRNKTSIRGNKFFIIPKIKR